jgi:hypothetical protein
MGNVRFAYGTVRYRNTLRVLKTAEVLHCRLFIRHELVDDYQLIFSKHSDASALFMKYKI